MEKNLPQRENTRENPNDLRAGIAAGRKRDFASEGEGLCPLGDRNSVWQVFGSGPCPHFEIFLKLKYQ
jgi:hypothetical protein